MSKDRSMFVRALLGVWHFINGARKVFLNVLFLLVLFAVVVVLMEPEKTVRLQSDTTLLLQPYGNVVEQYSGTLIDRAIQKATSQTRQETRLRDLIEAIDRAGRDRRIIQMVIDTDNLWSIGLSSLQDLERAINDFKATGKPVVAVADVMGQHQYYLASLADEIWLNPDGLVWIDGYSNIRNFYREGLDKLEVEVNLFRVGEYKTAMEPFVRDDMSPEAKEAALYWLGSLWQQYLEGVSRHRGIPLDTLNSAIGDIANRIEAVDGDFAQFALQLGLVDRLVNRPQARQELAMRGAPSKSGDSYRAIDVDSFLAASAFGQAGKSASNISVVVAEGEIVRGQQAPGRVGAETTIAQLRRVGRDSDVEAVVLRVDSPGGEVMASEMIRQEVQALRDNGKTVVVSMGDVAASGGYWIAMGADEVWANPATITGSIGVFGMIPTFGATLKKMGISSDGIGTTELAGKLRLDRPLDDDLRRVFQISTEHIYDDFLARVAEARGMDTEEVDKVARGRVWSGSQAAERGLIDRTGTLQDAIDAAARIAGLGSDYRVHWVQPELSAFETFLLELTSGVLARMNIDTGPAEMLRKSFLQNLLDDLRMIAGSDREFVVAAHCLCGLD